MLKWPTLMYKYPELYYLNSTVKPKEVIVKNYNNFRTHKLICTLFFYTIASDGWNSLYCFHPCSSWWAFVRTVMIMKQRCDVSNMYESFFSRYCDSDSSLHCVFHHNCGFFDDVHCVNISLFCVPFHYRTNPSCSGHCHHLFGCCNHFYHFCDADGD